MKLYWSPASRPSRTVHLFLEANNKIACEKVPIDLAKREQYAPSYEKINPFHKVPALQDGDFVLAESNAILRYLAQQEGVASHWYPQDKKQRAKVDQWLDVFHTEFRQRLTYNTFLRPFFTKQPTPPEIIEDDKKVIQDALTIINQHLEGSKFIAGGEEISIADLPFLMELIQVAGPAVMYDYSATAAGAGGHPHVTRWVNDCKAVLGEHIAAAQHLTDMSQKALMDRFAAAAAAAAAGQQK
eukprot:TRINITY_DN3724_c0_g2_i2.p1 TRINITY_DN3724_c0_g2~~TRINITY_DN3724_c0_g2_i2.p1  ORF type:complete len:253 (+),score=64.50 TRINITY_DN3724_c0_g2_i2:35-760(+)